MKIILASGSPRRSEILRNAGFNFEVFVPDADETYPHNIKVKDIPLFIAEAKMKLAEKVFTNNEIIITADTVVILNDEIIGKPKNEVQAKKILKKLSDKMHLVITGVCIKFPNEKYSFSETTKVYMDALTSDEINFYINNYKPFDKAGAYAIQEWIGINKISKIEGDYYNVVGFPMSRIYKILVK